MKGNEFRVLLLVFSDGSSKRNLLSHGHSYPPSFSHSQKRNVKKETKMVHKGKCSYHIFVLWKASSKVNITKHSFFSMYFVKRKSIGLYLLHVLNRVIDFSDDRVLSMFLLIACLVTGFPPSKI